MYYLKYTLYKPKCLKASKFQLYVPSNDRKAIPRNPEKLYVFFTDRLAAPNVYNLYNFETWRLLISISEMRAYKLSGLVSSHYFSIMPPFN